MRSYFRNAPDSAELEFRLDRKRVKAIPIVDSYNAKDYQLHSNNEFDHLFRRYGSVILTEFRSSI